MPKERLILERSDLLELTRRMNIDRNCFSRLAGAYLDEEGYVDGSFNIHFGKLTPAEKEKNLLLAKKIPFAETNVKLRGFYFSEEEKRPGTMRQLLLALRDCELKNDALMDSFYEIVGARYASEEPYAIYLFYGNYDVPVKGRNGDNMWESEEVYRFLVCAIGPSTDDYEMKHVDCGFLFPAFVNRSTEESGIAVFQSDNRQFQLLDIF